MVRPFVVSKKPRVLQRSFSDAMNGFDKEESSGGWRDKLKGALSDVKGALSRTANVVTSLKHSDSIGKKHRPLEGLPSLVSLQVGRQLWRYAPRQLRIELWMSSIYSKRGREAAASYEQYLKKEVDEESMADIIKDIPRTFPNTRQFHSEEGQAALRSVLLAYAAYDPEVGYCQGMNFLTGLLLMYLPREAHAFAALVVLMDKRGLRKFYSRCMSLLQVQLWQLGKLMSPKLNAHLESCGVLPMLYASSWLMTCFSADFPISFSARILDVMLSDRCEFALLKVAVTVLQHTERRLRNMTDLEQIINYLKISVPAWDEHRLDDILTEAFGKPWTLRQLDVLNTTEGAETVAQAMDRVLGSSHSAAAATAVSVVDDADDLDSLDDRDSPSGEVSALPTFRAVSGPGHLPLLRPPPRFGHGFRRDGRLQPSRLLPRSLSVPCSPPQAGSTTDSNDASDVPLATPKPFRVTASPRAPLEKVRTSGRWEHLVECHSVSEAVPRAAERLWAIPQEPCAELAEFQRLHEAERLEAQFLERQALMQRQAATLRPRLAMDLDTTAGAQRGGGLTYEHSAPQLQDDFFLEGDADPLGPVAWASPTRASFVFHDIQPDASRGLHAIDTPSLLRRAGQHLEHLAGVTGAAQLRFEALDDDMVAEVLTPSDSPRHRVSSGGLPGSQHWWQQQAHHQYAPPGAALGPPPCASHHATPYGDNSGRASVVDSMRTSGNGATPLLAGGHASHPTRPSSPFFAPINLACSPTLGVSPGAADLLAAAPAMATPLRPAPSPSPTSLRGPFAVPAAAAAASSAVEDALDLAGDILRALTSVDSWRQVGGRDTSGDLRAARHSFGRGHDAAAVGLQSGATWPEGGDSESDVTDDDEPCDYPSSSVWSSEAPGSSFFLSSGISRASMDRIDSSSTAACTSAAPRTATPSSFSRPAILSPFASPFTSDTSPGCPSLGTPTTAPRPNPFLAASCDASPSGEGPKGTCPANAAWLPKKPQVYIDGIAMFDPKTVMSPSVEPMSLTASRHFTAMTYEDDPEDCGRLFASLPMSFGCTGAGSFINEVHQAVQLLSVSCHGVGEVRAAALAAAARANGIRPSPAGDLATAPPSTATSLVPTTSAAAARLDQASTASSPAPLQSRLPRRVLTCDWPPRFPPRPSAPAAAPLAPSSGKAFSSTLTPLDEAIFSEVRGLALGGCSSSSNSSSVVPPLLGGEALEPSLAYERSCMSIAEETSDPKLWDSQDLVVCSANPDMNCAGGSVDGSRVGGGAELPDGLIHASSQRAAAPLTMARFRSYSDNGWGRFNHASGKMESSRLEGLDDLVKAAMS